MIIIWRILVFNKGIVGKMWEDLKVDWFNTFTLRVVYAKMIGILDKLFICKIPYWEQRIKRTVLIHLSKVYRFRDKQKLFNVWISIVWIIHHLQKYYFSKNRWILLDSAKKSLHTNVCIWSQYSFRLYWKVPPRSHDRTLK